jgi:putative Mn2+ efflux pump MntP
MSIIEQILIALALAMDCFSVSISSGLILKRYDIPSILMMAFCFGFFQALMPLFGWYGISYYGKYVESFDHWIAFGMLAIIGAKMIYDYFKGGGRSSFDPTKFTVVLLLAIATSIDAFAVGISFECMNMKTLGTITSPIIIIGVTSFVLSAIGNIIGVYVGQRFRFPATLIGGIILVGIGIKILIEHL